MADDTRYFLYARKSTDDKSRQVRSIEAQLAELNQIVGREGLKVVDTYIEKRSAKRPGRPIFDEMLARIERGDADGILAWHADRLSRNTLDGARIIDLFDTRKLKRLQFFGGFVENTPQGKMMLNAEFGFSKYYIDSLSVNVQRGHRNKIARGEYPNIAPIGYLNDSRMKRIVVDRDRAPVVRRAFEEYASGEATLESISAMFADSGVVTRRTRKAAGGKPLTRNSISFLLTNPIYYGDFRYNGEVYRGNHEPLITKQLYDAVQVVLSRRTRHSGDSVMRTEKPYIGLLRCAECGCMVTAEIQKGHTYYRCSKKRKGARCAQPFLREESLEAQLSALLADFALPDDWFDEMRGLLDSERRNAAATSAILTAESRTESDRLKARLQRLKEGYLDGIIEGDDYRRDKDAILGRIRSLEANIDELTAGKHGWLELLADWLSEAQTLGETAYTGSPNAKRALAEKIFGSNLVLDSRKARGEAVNPWSILGKSARGYTGAHVFYAARTYFQSTAMRRQGDSNG